MSRLVNFATGNYAQYVALTSKNEDTLYFLTNGKIYKGDLDVTSAVRVVADFPDTEIATHILYVRLTDLVAKTHDGNGWITINPGRVTTIDGSSTENDSMLVTQGAVKQYVISKIADITGGQGVIAGVGFNSETKNLEITKGDGSVEPLVMTGYAHDVTYENLTLTVPMFGGDPLVVNLPKDNFVRSGSYDPETKSIILKVGDSDDESSWTSISIPAASLVDIYTGTPVGSAASVIISVSDNVITGSINLDDRNAALKVDDTTGKVYVDMYTGSVTDATDDNNGQVASVATLRTATAAANKALEDYKTEALGLFDPLGSADQALADAKAYTDGRLTWKDVSGIDLT